MNFELNLFIQVFRRIGRVELIADFPLANILSDAVLVALVADRCFALGPLDQAFKIELIAAADNHIADFLGLDGPADGFGVHAE